MLAIISVNNFIDLLSHIFIFSILVIFSSFFGELVSEENITGIGVGLDHLAALLHTWYFNPLPSFKSVQYSQSVIHKYKTSKHSAAIWQP